MQAFSYKNFYSLGGNFAKKNFRQENKTDKIFSHEKNFYGRGLSFSGLVAPRL
jgi:hypothetical protein